MTPNQFHVLDTVRHTPGLTPPEIGWKVARYPSQVWVTLIQLQRRGRVRLEREHTTGVTYVFLTDQGREAHEEAQSVYTPAR